MSDLLCKQLLKRGDFPSMRLNKMRVVLFIHNFSRGAGSERATASLANYLVQQGCQVTILSICGDNTSFFEIDQRIQLATAINKPDVDNKMSAISVYMALDKFYFAHPIDLVIDVFSGLSLYTNLLKRKHGFRNITWEHFSLTNETRVSRFARRRALAQSDHYVVLTKTDLDSYLRRYPNIKDRITCIFNWTPYPHAVPLSYRDREKTVLTVGRLTQVKRFDRILKIWAMLENDNPDWTLKIAGTGELERSLRSLAFELNLRNVTFLGQVTDLSAFYKKASIVVSTSDTEALPMAMIEAQSFGVPIVSLDYLTGPRDIITPGYDGLIADGETEAEQLAKMAEQLSALMNDDETLSRMIRNAKASSARFESSAIGRQWRDVIESIVS